MTLFSDKTLSQKLERTEAQANAGFVESRARLYPESGAQWIEVAGAYAMFDGNESPAHRLSASGCLMKLATRKWKSSRDFFPRMERPFFTK